MLYYHKLFFCSHSYLRKNHLPRGDACLYNIFVWLEHSLELLLLCREKYFNVSILYKQLFSASNDVAVVRSHQLSHVFLSIHFWKDIWYNFAIILSVQRERLATWRSPSPASCRRPCALCQRPSCAASPNRYRLQEVSPGEGGSVQSYADAGRGGIEQRPKPQKARVADDPSLSLYMERRMCAA